MNKAQWKVFSNFKEQFKEMVNLWTDNNPELIDILKQVVAVSKSPAYPIETPVVYNKALDDISENDNIKIIVIGDNPGKDEQFIKNNKYLVGQAGKIAEGYFRRNPELGIDFRKNVIILNKTPVHSGKTALLKYVAKIGGEKISKLIEESQLWMAEKTVKLHCDLYNSADVESGDFLPELWLVGYSELKEKGIFSKYRECLKKSYFSISEDVWNKVFVFQHFSMNRFSIDLSKYISNNSEREKLTLIENIHQLGRLHKKEIFK